MVLAAVPVAAGGVEGVRVAATLDRRTSLAGLAHQILDRGAGAASQVATADPPIRSAGATPSSVVSKAARRHDLRIGVVLDRWVRRDAAGRAPAPARRGPRCADGAKALAVEGPW